MFFRFRKGAAIAAGQGEIPYDFPHGPPSKRSDCSGGRRTQKPGRLAPSRVRAERGEERCIHGPKGAVSWLLWRGRWSSSRWGKRRKTTQTPPLNEPSLPPFTFPARGTA